MINALLATFRLLNASDRYRLILASGYLDPTLDSILIISHNVEGSFVHIDLWVDLLRFLSAPRRFIIQCLETCLVSRLPIDEILLCWAIEPSNVFLLLLLVNSNAVGSGIHALLLTLRLDRWQWEVWHRHLMWLSLGTSTSLGLRRWWRWAGVLGSLNYVVTLVGGLELVLSLQFTRQIIYDLLIGFILGVESLQDFIGAHSCTSLS